MKRNKFDVFYSARSRSLSPLRRQVIMESSDSLASQASSLPPKICENPEYLPPALPPKRHRTNAKLNNLNVSPPSSPKLILTESIETPTNDSSSQSINNNVLNNNRNKIENNLPIVEVPVTPTSPSSNYVQMSTSTINAAATAEAAKQKVEPPKSPTTIKSNNQPVSNSISDSSAVNNDVRVIYSNVNLLSTTNNRSSDESHYIQLYDGSGDDRKPNSIVKIDGVANEKTAKDNDRCSAQQNSSQIINNNNNSINDKNADDEEDIVVLRRPQASSNSSLKVLIA